MIYKDYERIKTIIGDIYEENADFLNSIPIDIIGLAKRMGFNVIFASAKASKNFKSLQAYQMIKKTKQIDGLSLYDQSKNSFVIYIDDLDTSIIKQRFSVAHEIGHIVLNHTECNERTEREANYFASYLLCPDCL